MRDDDDDLFDWAEHKYPFTPGFAKDSATSEAAAESMIPYVGGMRARIMTHIRENGGATCDELQIVLGMLAQTCSARCCELKLYGLLEESGLTRLTRSKREAAVLVATPEGMNIEVKPPKPSKAGL